MVVNGTALRVPKACILERTIRCQAKCRPTLQLQATKSSEASLVSTVALVGVALITFASPTAAIGPASIIKDELTEPSTAPEMMAPSASLEQLPVSPPPADAVKQNSTATGPSNDTPSPGEAATPPAPKRRLSRLQELQQARDDLRAKQQELLRKTEELKEKEQTISILQEELDIERVLRALLENDKDKAEEMAKLATALCSGAMIPP